MDETSRTSRRSPPAPAADAVAEAEVRPTPAPAAPVGTDGGDALRLAIEAARLASDLHCGDLLVLDVRGLSQLTHFIVLGTGTSDRQIRAVGQNLEKLAEASGFPRYGREGDGAATWLVLDFVEVIVHLFEPATRAHYDLEMLWGDAPRVAWARQGRDA